jgi:hypothetical protein
MNLDANCQTTAMGIMPHRDIDRALELAFSLDIPFWPQLPKVHLHEDMYVQASEHFPGITVDEDGGKITLDHASFAEQLEDYSAKMMDEDFFRLTPGYSVVYHRFMERPLEGYPAVRGQQIGPVSFGFKVTDEDKRPIIYDDEVRTILFDFMQRKANAQYREMREHNANAFVWLDEPGLGWVFSGMTGYDDIRARSEYRDFLQGMAGPPALHLCANVNLPYLLELGIEVLSFDAYQIDVMPKGYAAAVAAFIEGGGIIAWGIVPVDSLSLSTETAETLAERLAGYWGVVAAGSNVTAERLARQALLAPARCMLKDAGLVGAPGEKSADGARDLKLVGREERLVEQAFTTLAEVSSILRRRYGL